MGRILRTAVRFIGVMLILLVFLGFHFITYPTLQGRRFCILPKVEFSIDSTFATGDSEVDFTLRHPFIAGRLALGHGACARF